MGDNDKDDVSTIVLDFGDLKSKLDEEEDIIEDDETLHDLAFTTDMLNDKNEATSASINPVKNQKKIFVFGYKTNFFKENQNLFSTLENLTTMTKINDLNKHISENPDGIFIMYFNDTPKAINQISEQIKRKFEKASSIIIAKNLSIKKAQEHKASKYGANGYLNEPFSVEDLEAKIQEIMQ